MYVVSTLQILFSVCGRDRSNSRLHDNYPHQIIIEIRQDAIQKLQQTGRKLSIEAARDGFNIEQFTRSQRYGKMQFKNLNTQKENLVQKLRWIHHQIVTRSQRYGKMQSRNINKITIFVNLGLFQHFETIAKYKNMDKITQILENCRMQIL